MMDRVSRTTIIVGFGLQRDSFIRNATVRLNCNFTRAVGRGQPVTVSLLPPLPFSPPSVVGPSPTAHRARRLFSQLGPTQAGGSHWGGSRKWHAVDEAGVDLGRL